MPSFVLPATTFWPVLEHAAVRVHRGPHQVSTDAFPSASLRNEDVVDDDGLGPDFDQTDAPDHSTVASEVGHSLG